MTVLNDLLTTANLISITGVILGIIAAIMAVRNIIKASSEDKEVKKIKAREEIAKKERQEKLGLETLRMPLFFDNEKLDYLHAQYKIKQSPFEIKGIKLTKSAELDLGFDAKFSSLESKKNTEEEYSLRENSSQEMKYVTILSWLSDEDRLVNDTEESDQLDKLVTVIEQFFLADPKLKERIGSIPSEYADVIAEALESKEKKVAKKIQSVQQKFILLRGNFRIKENDGKQFEIVRDGTTMFSVRGLTQCCTDTGKDTFNTGNIIKASVFGYVPNVANTKSPIMITPIAIHQLLG